MRERLSSRFFCFYRSFASLSIGLGPDLATLLLDSIQRERYNGA